MGSFGGHILPGSFFLLFGFWWTYSVTSRYFKSLTKRSSTKKHLQYHCTCTYESLCCPNVPIEGFIKIFGAVTGIIVEWTAAMEDGHFKYIGNAQHINMFMFFGINGLCDSLIFYGYPLPADSDYISLALACMIEALLFSFHLHGRTPLDVQIHTLLIIAILASAVSCFVELRFRNNVLSSYFRAFSALLQGSWFYQIGFTLYSPFSESPVHQHMHQHVHNHTLGEHNHGSDAMSDDMHYQMMLITAVFCWHIASIICFIGIFGYCFFLRYRSLLNLRDPSLRGSDEYPEIKYSNFDNDVSMDLMVNAKNKNTINGVKHENTVNNNLKGKYSLNEESDDEV